MLFPRGDEAPGDAGPGEGVVFRDSSSGSAVLLGLAPVASHPTSTPAAGERSSSEAPPEGEGGLQPVRPAGQLRPLTPPPMPTRFEASSHEISPPPAAQAAAASQRGAQVRPRTTPPSVPRQAAAPRPTHGASALSGRSPRIHTIVDGDTLERLAQRYLGDARREGEIFAANRGVLSDPELLPIGATIVIPQAPAATPRIPGALAVPASGASRQGDDLAPVRPNR